MKRPTSAVNTGSTTGRQRNGKAMENGFGNGRNYGFYGWRTADVRDRYGITPRGYYDLLSSLWCADTCAPRMRGDWTEENRTLGQCSVTAFLLQDIYGGKVYGVPLGDGNFHCFNDVGGCVFDLTSEQFGDTVLRYDNCPEQDRSVHFAKEEKKLRYEKLKAALGAAMPRMIETKRLILRPFFPDDAEDVYGYLRDPGADCFADMRLSSPEEARAETERRQAEKEYCLAIVLKETGRVIGEIFGHPEGMFPGDQTADTFSPCWMLDPAHGGRGYAFEAVSAYIDRLFGEKGIRRVYAYTADTNLRSRRLCEKLGMRQEGLFLEHVSFTSGPDGKPAYENTVQYAILKREWEEKRALPDR